MPARAGNHKDPPPLFEQIQINIGRNEIMAPLPKRKISRGRRDRRRSHLAIGKVHLVTCPQCHHKHLPHHVCPYCGYYAGREVIQVEEKEK